MGDNEADYRTTALADAHTTQESIGSEQGGAPVGAARVLRDPSSTLAAMAGNAQRDEANEHNDASERRVCARADGTGAAQMDVEEQPDGLPDGEEDFLAQQVSAAAVCARIWWSGLSFF
jgi:hypothetical protein